MMYGRSRFRMSIALAAVGAAADLIGRTAERIIVDDVEPIASTPPKPRVQHPNTGRYVLPKHYQMQRTGTREAARRKRQLDRIAAKAAQS